MKVKLAYGKSGLAVEFPDDWDVTVIEPRFAPGLADEAGAIRTALRSPIGCEPLATIAQEHLAQKGGGTRLRVGIIFSDITRPAPNHIILPALLAELHAAGIQPDSITLFNALGTHRPNTQAELRAMLGDDIVRHYRVEQNNAFDPGTQANLGRSSRGHDIWLNRSLLECDLKILTGFIEPHFFAGFSGGGKAVMPGMAGLRTVLGNHDAEMIGNPNATWGVTHGNPIWEEAREAALRTNRSTSPTGLFLLNVTLNRDKRITGIFAGDLDAAHAQGCAFVRRTAMVPVAAPFDIVVTTNSGYPLDLNLYQTVKGMCAASQVVKPKGAIIAAAECWDGIPDHGLYGKLLREASSPRELLERIHTPGFLEQDQWEAQVQANVQLKADVYLHSAGLTDEQVARALLKPCRDIEATVTELRQRIGPQARICILPEGPQTVAYLQS